MALFIFSSAAIGFEPRFSCGMARDYVARQCRRAERHGLDVSTQTLWDQHFALARHLEPTWQKLWDLALAEEVLHVDETGWKMMGSRKKTNWTLFGLTAPSLAVYHLASSKLARATHEILQGFSGTLVVDGYKVYPIVAELEGNIRIAHCWAHADRKFKDAKDPPDQVSQIREWIAQLYEIEREVSGPFPGDAAAQAKRQGLRATKSAAVVSELRALAFSLGGLRRSGFGKALRYLLSHWEGLTLFLEDPRIALDNNAAERVLRGPVIGRKNFYGTRSKRGAKAAAILYSLIETAKLSAVNPSVYLREAAIAAIRFPGSVTLPARK
ncbi:MAG: IS66 family transposase [Acidobacteriota bacterium]